MILDYHHLPICAIMLLFFGAFFITTFGTRGGVRKIVSMIASALSLACLIALIKPVMIDGEIISYWLGNRSIAGGYAIGIAIEVDALSLFFGLLVGIAAFAACLYSLDYITHDAHQVQYYTLLLMTSGGVLGMVLTGDIFNMYIMVEILTIGAVGLTAYRSKSEGALEAAFKYLVVGSIGSAFILTAIVMLYAEAHTLNLAQLAALLPGMLGSGRMKIAFALLLAGFSTKAFIVPFHPLAAGRPRRGSRVCVAAHIGRAYKVRSLRDHPSVLFPVPGHGQGDDAVPARLPRLRQYARVRDHGACAA